MKKSWSCDRDSAEALCLEPPVDMDVEQEGFD